MRTVTAKGTKYVQLCHNYHDPEKGRSRTRVLYSFGRADELDMDALRRLVGSICRYLDPEEAEKIRKEIGTDETFQFLGSRKLGGTWLLDGLWKKMSLDRVLEKLLRSRGYSTPIERLLYAMVANRALEPSSKLAMEDWVAGEVMIDGLSEVEVHQLYRAMDFLLEAEKDIQLKVYQAVVNLFNMELDLVFLDTTTTYFEIEGEGNEGFRKWGFNKDNHPELAQVVIGFAMTRDGIPIRCWVWPGNTSDKSVIDEVKRDFNGWKLGRVIMVMDTGFNSENNRRILQGAGDHYIIGEKMRLGPDGNPPLALQRAGKYQKLDNGLEIKEVIVGGDSEARRRFVIVYNPVEAEHDRKKRDDILADVERKLEEMKQLEGEPHTKAACSLRSHSAYGRYIRQTKTGKLCLDRARIKAEAHLDGKFLVSTSDDWLSTEDVALGYKHLWKIERLNRDLKNVVDVRPVYHRLEDRIRAHVLLCWLALVLIRVAENESLKTWHEIKNTLSTLEVGIHQTGNGQVWQRTPINGGQRELFGALQIKPPPPYPNIAAPQRKRPL